MIMHIPKRYGESKIEPCPFCGRQAIVRNSQKIPVCKDHKDSVLEDLKCVCGNYLETKVGKFGLYFSCPKCGNMNPKRVLEMNPPKSRVATVPNSSSGSSSGRTVFPERKPVETVVSPDDPRYFG